MANYLIRKNNDNNIILKQINYEFSYELNPKMKDTSTIKICKINIFNKSMIDDLVTKKILEKYQQIFKMVYLYTSDNNASGDDAIMCLGEIEKLESIIRNKYQKYLSIEKYKYFMHELYALGAAVNKKAIMNRINNTFMYDEELEEEKHHTM
ncbi:MAG: hypothetical protein J5892_05270 [Bacilli bacterium]|nr:hypothetical protein [Bacilli bacterium]